jgi:hypothetical protein
MRVSEPAGVKALVTMLGVMTLSDEARVRHHNGMLVIEEPTASLLDAEKAAAAE